MGKYFAQIVSNHVGYYYTSNYACPRTDLFEFFFFKGCLFWIIGNLRDLKKTPDTRLSMRCTRAQSKVGFYARYCLDSFCIVRKRKYLQSLSSNPCGTTAGCLLLLAAGSFGSPWRVAHRLLLDRCISNYDSIYENLRRICTEKQRCGRQITLPYCGCDECLHCDGFQGPVDEQADSFGVGEICRFSDLWYLIRPCTFSTLISTSDCFDR